MMLYLYIYKNYIIFHIKFLKQVNKHTQKHKLELLEKLNEIVLTNIHNFKYKIMNNDSSYCYCQFSQCQPEFLQKY